MLPVFLWMALAIASREFAGIIIMLELKMFCRKERWSCPLLRRRTYPVLHALGRFMPAILQACFT